MTIIAFDGTTMAADRASWCGGQASRVCKIFKEPKHHLPFTREPVLIGFAGSAAFASQVLEWIRVGGPKPDVPESMKEKGCALIADRRGRVWRLMAVGLVGERLLDRVAVYGAETGMGLALGYMLAGGSARGAVLEVIKRTDVAALGVDCLSFKERG